jgi:transcription initiation factor TFIIIB Brf1 subunit/transcription initiation factor TFIIB
MLGAGGLAAVVPKIIDGIRAARSGKAREEKAENRTALGRLVAAQRELDSEASYRREVENFAGLLERMLIQLGVPRDKLPAWPVRKRR